MKTHSTDKINKALKELEEALQITIEEESDEKPQKNTYKSYNNRFINYLTLHDIDFQNFDKLEPVFKLVTNLRLTNCTIHDIATLVHLEYINHLILDSVKLPYKYQPNALIADTIGNHFQNIELRNMEVMHPSILLPLSKNLRYLKFVKCKVHNLYEVNLLPELYSLSFRESTFHPTHSDKQHIADPKRRFIFLNFEDMKINNFDSFLPISKTTTVVDIDNCVIDSFQGIHKFPQLETIRIDACTTVKSKEIPKDKSSSFLLNQCDITEADSEKPGTIFNFQKLAGIAPYIKSFSFDNDKYNNTEFLKHFTQLQTIRFDKITVNFNHFKSVAHQIKTISISTCTLKNAPSLAHFTQLEELYITDGYKEGVEIRPLKDLKQLIPLQHQLKKLSATEENIKGLEHIANFTALEGLELFEVSEKIAKHIFSLPNLKRLSIYIANEKECFFNLKGLRKIEKLSISCDEKVTLEGMEHLDHLEFLELDDEATVKDLHHLKKLAYFKCNESTNINEVGTIETLKRLEFDANEEYEINGLEQFPNLEMLSLPGKVEKITLGKLNNLKVLNMEFGSPEGIDFLTQLPNLEKLDLGYRGIAKIPDLSKLTKLKMLSLSENGNIEDIEILKHLKNLEDLNLYDNKISDIRILNTLPCLKEVNIAGNPIDKKEVYEQLDHPEIAVFLGLPYVPFRIWSDDYFEI